MKKIKVGIIGGTHGMGKWFAGLLKKEGCVVHVSGRKTKLGIIDLARLCNVIVVAVPISATADIIKQVGPLLSKDTLLMDLTSLKKEPVKADAEKFQGGNRRLSSAFRTAIKRGFRAECHSMSGARGKMAGLAQRRF